MDIHNDLPKQPTLFYGFLFLVGVCFMAAAGYLLIQGLAKFSVNADSQFVLFVFGILFQVGESVCFISAARRGQHSYLWRIGLFSLGLVLFVFSIGVITLAQKATMQAGANAASAIDVKRDHLRAQIAKLDRTLESQRRSAEKQSRSTNKRTRALGKDSMNRVAELENQKLTLSDQLLSFSQSRRETSLVFFTQLTDIVGLPAQSIEFYYLVLRAFLIELCGIVFLAYGAFMWPLAPQIIRQSEEKIPAGDHLTQANEVGPSWPEDEDGADLEAGPHFGTVSHDDESWDDIPEIIGYEVTRQQFDDEPTEDDSSRLEPFGAEEEADAAGFWGQNSSRAADDNVLKFANTQDMQSTKKQTEVETLALKMIKAYEAQMILTLSRDNIKKYLNVGNPKANLIKNAIDRIQSQSLEEI